jgi:hypothetical protein
MHELWAGLRKVRVWTLVVIFLFYDRTPDAPLRPA